MPANPPFPPANWPPADADVLAALERAYADGSWGRYDGPNSHRLEASLRQLNQVEHVHLCSSGTIAVELALRGLKVAAGDEVILAGYDFAGNFRAVKAIGARPVLVDLANHSWGLDGSQVAAAASSHTKAVIASHLHGSLVDMPTLLAVAAEKSLVVIEDACQAPGAMVHGKPAGSWGDCGIHSFGGSKLLTAGRGGAIVTGRADVVQRIKVFSERGNQAFPLSELQAAVLPPQIEKLAGRNLQRQQNVESLVSQCSDLPGLRPLRLSEGGNLPAFYKLAWLVERAAEAQSTEEAERIRKSYIIALQAKGVNVDAGFRGFAKRSSSRCRIHGDLANATRAATGTILLHHPLLLESAEVMDQLAEVFRDVATELV